MPGKSRTTTPTGNQTLNHQVSNRRTNDRKNLEEHKEKKQQSAHACKIDK